jgi:hypothetical protein
MNAPSRGYAAAVIPDDAADRPLTPGERAVIDDLERQLLLDEPPPWHPGVVARPARVSAAPPRPEPAPTSALPLVALLGTACVLVAVLAVVGGGLLGAVAVVASVVATALVWPLVPAGLGGPVRPRRRPYRTPGPLQRRR